MVSAISERLSRLKPRRYITTSVPTSESGTERLGMIVAGKLRRKTKMTSTTSTTASPSSNSTTDTDARIVFVRSLKIEMLSALGRLASICGSKALIPSTTWMTFAPGCR